MTSATSEIHIFSRNNTVWKVLVFGHFSRSVTLVRLFLWITSLFCFFGKTSNVGLSGDVFFYHVFPYYLRQYTSKFLYEMRPTKLSNSSIHVQETNTFTHFCFVIILNSLGFLWKSHNMFLNTYIPFYHNRNLQLRLIYHVCVSSSIVSMIKNHR